MMLTLLILLATATTAICELNWEVPIGEEHLKRIFGKEVYDNGNIPEYKLAYAYPREERSTGGGDSPDIAAAGELLYSIETLDEILNLTLSLNSRLLSRSSVVQMRRQDGSLETIDSFPKNCYYTGRIDGNTDSLVAVSLCGGEMVGVVETDEDSYLIEPIVRSSGEGSPHIAYKVQRSPLPEIENIGGASDDGALPCSDLEKPENGRLTVNSNKLGSRATYRCNKGFKRMGPRVRRCLPTGLWSGFTPVCVPRNPNVKAAGGSPQLLCPDLTNPRWGRVDVRYDIDNGLFMATYSCDEGRSLNGDQTRFCLGTNKWSGQQPTCIPDEMLDVYLNGLNQDSKRKRREEVPVRSMETLVYVDYGVVEFHGADLIVNYIMAMMNIVASLYCEPTLETQIDIVISRMILELEGPEDGLVIPENANAALNTFCEFQTALNDEDESSPFHHDHAIYITSVDLCAQDDTGVCNSGVVGFAPVGGMCSFSRSCTINEDRGLGSAFVLAHETGHNLGMQHDGFMNDCVGSQRIMAPSASGQEELFLWSTCSADYLRTFLNSGNGQCLDDVPIGDRLNASALEGINFDADAQCRAAYGPAARFCPGSFADEEICSRLWCQPDPNSNCFTRNVPPADGTSCGENMICVRGTCEDAGDIEPVDGGWSSFGPYSECSRSCESGVRFRERRCNNPTPAFGGAFCVGEAREYEVCNTDACPDGAPDFRDVQCADTNILPFNGEFYRWEAFTGPVVGVTPCQLICRAIGSEIIAIRALSVVDGTKCSIDSSSSAICIQGACTPLGCDNVLNSGLQEDICGVCNGNGSDVTSVADSASGSGSFGYSNVGIIPAGAKNVRISDTSLSAVIALQLGDEEILNADFGLFPTGSFSIPVAGITVTYNRSISGLDVAQIDGPLPEELFIRILITSEAGTYSISWEYQFCGTPPTPPPPPPPTTTTPTPSSSFVLPSSLVITFSAVESSTVSIRTTPVSSPQPTSLSLSSAIPTSSILVSTIPASTSTMLFSTSVPVPTKTVVPMTTSISIPGSSSMAASIPIPTTSTPLLPSATLTSILKPTVSIVPTTAISMSTSMSEFSSTTSVPTTTLLSETTSLSIPESSAPVPTTSVLSLPTTTLTSISESTTSIPVPMTTLLFTTITSTTVSESTTSIPLPTTSIPTTSSMTTSTSIPMITSTTTRLTSSIVTTSVTSSSTFITATPIPDPTPVECVTYDVCGVCNGDNSSATVITSSSSSPQPVGFGYYDLVTIPTGAQHVMIYEEPSTTDNFLALSVNGASLLNNRFRISRSPIDITDSNGVVFHYVGSPVEAITTEGPLAQPLTVQALVGVSRSVYSVMWKYVMCDVSPTSTTTPVTSTVTTAPTPDFVIPLWVGSDYSNCFLNENGNCIRSREVYCEDGLTGIRLNDDLCAARRQKLRTTRRCGAFLCQ